MKQDKILEAEKQLQQALAVANQEGFDFLQVDIRIDMLEFYVSNSEIRRASQQLILLDGQRLSEIQRVRLLGVHARMAQAEGAHQKAATLFVEARKVAGAVFKWGLATDLGLLAIEALLDAGTVTAASTMLETLKEEASNHIQTRKTNK